VTIEDYDAFARQSQATVPQSLGSCRRCGRPTTRSDGVEGTVRHRDPSGRLSWRTCRAASKEWIPQESGARGPTWDESLNPHWVARPPKKRTDAKAVVTEPLPDDAPSVGDNEATSAGPEMLIVVTRTPLVEWLIDGGPRLVDSVNTD